MSGAGTEREPLFDTVAIAGMGLIGGSLGMALRQRGLARRVVGWVRREDTIYQAVALGAADEATTRGPEAVRGAELLVLATPILTMPALVESVAHLLKKGTVVTDAGSTKAYLHAAIPPLLPPGVHYVGGHPMAGSEQAGIEAARADLFEGATYVLTASEGSEPEPLARLAAMARGLGARPLEIDAGEHDRAVAWISHLPHVTAAALAATARQGTPSLELAQLLAAGGFRDTTRIAASPAEMWRDVCLTNADPLLSGLDALEAILRDFRAAIRSGDAGRLQALFTAGARGRDQILGSGESPADPNHRPSDRAS